MHENHPHPIYRPIALRTALRVTLLASALALAGCASTDNGGGLSSLTPPPNNLATTPPSDSLATATPAAQGPLQAALTNTGAAVDNVADTGLKSTLGNVGKQLDGPLTPLYATVESTTQTVGAQTGLGKPIDGVLNQAGGAVSNIGNQLGNSGLPGGLGQGVGALVTGAGDAVTSAGGLLNRSADNPDPLANTLASATGGIDGLTRTLTDTGGLLQPLAGPLNNAVGGALSVNGFPILQPALGNTGQAVDQLLPLHLKQPLGNLGKSLDGVVSPAGGAVTQVGQKIGDGLGVGVPVDQLLTSLGASLQQAGNSAGSAVPGLNGVMSNLGATIASVGGIVHNTPVNANPLGNTLNNATQTVIAITSGLDVGGISQKAGGNALGGLLGTGSGVNPLGSLLGGAIGNGGSSGSLVSSLSEGGKTDGSTGGALAPVTGLVSGLLGGLGGLGGK